MTFEVDMVVRYFVAALSRCGIYLDTVELTPEGTGTDKVNCTWFPDSTDPTVCVDEPPTTVSPPHGECPSPSPLLPSPMMMFTGSHEIITNVLSVRMCKAASLLMKS